MERLYHQCLTGSDRELLEGTVGGGESVTAALTEPATEEVVFGRQGPTGVAVGVSPFLVSPQPCIAPSPRWRDDGYLTIGCVRSPRTTPPLDETPVRSATG